MSDLKARAKEIALLNYSKGKVLNEEEFSKDYAVFLSTRRQISRFLSSSSINEKIIINNIVILLNIFGTIKVTKVFRLLLDDPQFSVVKAVLIFLRQYEWSIGQDVYPNRIMVDILKDTSHRFNLDHL